MYTFLCISSFLCVTIIDIVIAYIVLCLHIIFVYLLCLVVCIRNDRTGMGAAVSAPLVVTGCTWGGQNDHSRWRQWLWDGRRGIVAAHLIKCRVHVYNVFQNKYVCTQFMNDPH